MPVTLLGSEMPGGVGWFTLCANEIVDELSM
jgi:hypothetical protein